METSWLGAWSSRNMLPSGDATDLQLFRTTLISCIRHLSNNTSKKTSSDVHLEEALGGRSSQTGSKGFP